MPLIPLDIPPGVYRNGTEYESQGRWFASKLVRWYQKTLQPFGGWRRVANAELDGPGRGLLTWRWGNFGRQAMVGTPDSLYVWDTDNLITITPVGLPAGVLDSFAGPGFGYGPFGMGPFGVASGSPATTATTWALDTWGEHALALATHSGVLYEYSNNGLPAEPVANAPIGCWMFVTEEGIVMLLGAGGDLKLVQWCGQQNNTLWTPAPTNAAGDYRFQTDGVLVGGMRVKGANLLWTSSDVWRARFVGGVYIYSFDRVSRNCGLIAPLAAQALPDGRAVWMGAQNFYLWDGSQVKTLPCALQDYVFQDINLAQAAKFSSGQVSAKGEVIFSYCSAESETIDRCIAWNWQEGPWAIIDPDGTMPRGCWSDVGAFENPMAAGENGLLYDQETGFDADNVPLIEERFAMTGPLELGNGDQVMEVTQVLPDDRTFGGMQLHFIQRFAPEGPVTNRGPYEVRRPYTDVRLTARQVQMRLESISDEDFRFGRQRLNAMPGGER